MRKIIKTLLGIGGAFCLIGALLFSMDLPVAAQSTFMTQT